VLEWCGGWTAAIVVLPILRPNLRQPQSDAYLRRSGDLERHFATASPSVRITFDKVLDALAGLGPLTVLPEKTRIALHVRMSFAAFVPRRWWLGGHLVLARRIDNPRFHRIETYSPRNVLHAFRLTAPEDVDDEFREWLVEAYHVGEQPHLS
jgi:hypothetical protein